MENLSPKQRAEVIRIHHINGNSCTRTRRTALRELNVSLTEDQVRRLAKNLGTKNTVDPKVLASRRGIAGRQPIEDNYNTVLVSLLEDRELSIRRRSLLLGIPRSSMQLIISKLGFHAYRMRRVHALQEGDFERRINFCNWALQRKLNNPNFLYLIMMSDEAKFNISGLINSTNAYHYSIENEHVFLEAEMERRGVMAWAAMTANVLIGPFFFEGNVNQGSYLRMLQDNLVPALQQPALADLQIYFMQDGARPHRTRMVFDFLHEHFGNRIIGLGADITWPPRSPDLTPLDFFLWGYLKNIVYKRKYNNVDELKLAIAVAAQTITPVMLESTMKNFFKRLEACVRLEGRQVEPHL